MSERKGKKGKTVAAATDEKAAAAADDVADSPDLTSAGAAAAVINDEQLVNPNFRLESMTHHQSHTPILLVAIRHAYGT